MKFITLILSALMVLGVVTAQICYKNGESPTPGCNLKKECILLDPSKITANIQKCVDTKSIVQIPCNILVIVESLRSCLDLLSSSDVAA